jgi:hypothetical protein
MPEGLETIGPFPIEYDVIQDTIGSLSVNPDSLVNSAQGYAANAIGQINNHMDRVADIALTQFNVTLPQQVSQGVDFDMSQAALQNVMGRAPAAPTVDDIPIDLPAEPTVDLPTIPDVDSTATSIINAVFAKLLADVQNGTYGIDTADEQALWERARDREAAALRDAAEQIREEFTSTGFSLPPGAMVKAMNKARKTYYDNIANTNREIAIKRAELYRDARRFAIEQIMKLEEVLLANITAKLEAAKAIVTIYQTQVEAWKARLEVEKIQKNIEVEVYKGQVDGYRAEIQGIVSSFELGQKAREDEYRSIVNALSANTEVAKLLFSELAEQAKLRMTGATAAAEVYRNVAAAAIGATHVNVGLSESASYGKSYSISNTSSVQAQIQNSYGESKRLGDDYQKTEYHTYKEK